MPSVSEDHLTRLDPDGLNVDGGIGGPSEQTLCRGDRHQDFGRVDGDDAVKTRGTLQKSAEAGFVLGLRRLLLHCG